jgi:hypothetical protein
VFKTPTSAVPPPERAPEEYPVAATFASVRSLLLGALLGAPLLCSPARIGAQAPLITVPRRTLGIDLSGSFYPNDQVWDQGSKRPLGSLIDGQANPVVTSLQSSLTQLLGHPVSGLSLGGALTVAAREHGVGDIGFAFGLTRRITIFGTIPIVYVRSRVSTGSDTAAANVGLNPAHPVAANTAGAAQTALFFDQFASALSQLADNITNGSYAGDAQRLALARQTLTSGTALRGALFTLLADTARASPVLPTTTDANGMALLAQIGALQTAFGGEFGVSGFAVAPALPTATLGPADLGALIGDQSALGLGLPNALPRYGIGDMEAGIAVQLVQRDTAGSDSWQSVWVRVRGRFPNGAPADPDILLSQETGSRQPAIQADGIVDLGRKALTLRMEVNYLHSLPANELVRIGSPEQLLLPPGNRAAVRIAPGDSLSLMAQPYLRIAPHLAVTGLVQYWRRGANSSDYVAGQIPVDGATVTDLDIGSKANAVVLGIGLSYSHDGRGTEGKVALPVEAGWSLERTISSSSGIFPVTMTTRVYLRIYRPLFR